MKNKLSLQKFISNFEMNPNEKREERKNKTLKNLVRKNLYKSDYLVSWHQINT